MFNSMTPPPVSSYGEPCCLRPLPSQGAPGMGTEGQYIRQSLDLDPWQTSHPAPGLPLPSHSSFHIQDDLRSHATCDWALLGVSRWTVCVLTPVPQSSCISFLRLPGLPFCHQAARMPGPSSYGPARDANSCVEGEASGNLSSLSAPLGSVLRKKVGGQGIYLGRGNAWRWDQRVRA